MGMDMKVQTCIWMHTNTNIPKPKGYPKEETPRTLSVHPSVTSTLTTDRGLSLPRLIPMSLLLLSGSLSQMSSTVLCPQVSHWNWFFTYNCFLGHWQLSWAFSKRRCFSLWPSLFTEQHLCINKKGVVKKEKIQSTIYSFTDYSCQKEGKMQNPEFCWDLTGKNIAFLSSLGILYDKIKSINTTFTEELGTKNLANTRRRVRVSLDL